MNYTALREATFRGNLEVVKLLVSNGAEVNEKHRSRDGATPLHMAVYRNRLDLAKFLVSAGADVKAKHNDSIFVMNNRPFFHILKRLWFFE